MDAREISYNPHDPDFYANVRSTYTRLREEAPVYWSDRLQMWVLSRYEDVRAASLNWKVFSNAASKRTLGQVARFFDKYPNLISHDPPRHSEMRRVLGGVVSPARMLSLRDKLRKQIADLFAPFEHLESIDLIQDFADIFPSQVIAELLGIPLEDSSLLRSVSNAITDYSQEDIDAKAAAAMHQLGDYYTEFFEERAKRPAGDDIVWQLLEAESRGVLSRKEVLGFAILMTIAGAETTTKMIGNMALLLYRNPDQRAILVESPELIRNAVEEALRYHSSTHLITRTLTDDVTMHGQEMHKGEMVALLFNAASNDRRKFDNPDTFDVHRKLRGDHLAFGGGVHACLGAPLARLELVLTFEEILKRWPNYSIDKSGLVRTYNPIATGFKHMPFHFNRPD